MIKRIELKNFMSHRHTVLEPAAGLTVLVGPNNCGKSAVVAALQILCHNENSTYVMRHGERECSVEVQTSDGHTVRWTRKNSPSYLIDGQPFDRLQRLGLPEPLHQALRLPKVDAGDDTSFDIHFGCQKSPIFLLDRPAAAAAKFFASSSDAIRLVEMQRKHREKHADKQREKVRLEEESKEVNAQLDALQAAGAIDQRVKAAEGAHHELTQLAAALVQIETESSRLEGQATTAAYHEAQARAMDGLVPMPELMPVEQAEELIGRIGDGLRECSLAEDCSAALQPLRSPPALFDLGLLESMAGEMRIRWEGMKICEGTQEALFPLVAPPVVETTVELESLMERLADGARTLGREASRGQVLQSLSAPELPADVGDLVRCLETLQAAESALVREMSCLRTVSELHAPAAMVPLEPLELICGELQQGCDRLEALERQVRQVEAQRTQVAADIRERATGAVCGTCGAPLDAERLLAHAAAHGGNIHE